MNMVPWKGTPFTNRGAFWCSVLFFSCQLKGGMELFFLAESWNIASTETSWGLWDTCPPHWKTSPNKVKLIWIEYHDWFDFLTSIMSGPLFRINDFFFWKKTSPTKKGRGHFHLKLWRYGKGKQLYPLSNQHTPFFQPNRFVIQMPARKNSI